MNKKLNTPVLFLTFNRLDTTKQVFSAISEAKPPRLYVTSDGAREGVGGEKEKVDNVRSYVLNNINWDCEVKTLFRDRNLGCGKAVSEAITWFFNNEEQGIILEDDCLPDQSFFYFCEELLERYKDDERIMHIGGSNFQFDDFCCSDDYYFSKIIHVWGWATWRKSWSKYDFNMETMDLFIKKRFLRDIINDNDFEKYWSEQLCITKMGLIDTWDYQWMLSLWSNYGLSIIPRVNLVSNIGFGKEATHTKGLKDKRSKLPFKNMLKIIHPKMVCRDYVNDFLYFKKNEKKSEILKILIFLKKVIKSIFFKFPYFK